MRAVETGFDQYINEGEVATTKRQLSLYNCFILCRYEKLE